MVRAIIVDDEKNGRENLRNLLSEHCPDVEICGTAESATVARDLVKKTSPDLVFLDIQMPKLTGFEFLEFYEKRPFHVVFVTAYNQFALRAIKAAAVDYVLKPIDIEALRTAVDRVKELCNNHPDPKQISGNSTEQLRLLLENLDSAGKFKKIFLNVPRGFKIVNISEILFLKGENNYTSVYLEAGDCVISSGSLKEFEFILGEEYFFRVHKSYVVNLMHVREFTTDGSGMVELSSGEKVTVSVRRIKPFIERIQKFVASSSSVRSLV